MAPGAAIAASIPAGVAFAGGSLPLSVVFALVACLLCAWCIGLLAREMPAAGSLATYAARGIHPAAGFLVAWGYVLVGWLIPPLVLLQLGFTTAATLNSEFHGCPATLWWPACTTRNTASTRNTPISDRPRTVPSRAEVLMP